MARYSLAVLRGLGAVTFSRAVTTTANTYIDRYGVFKSAGLDVPRFEKEGLLLEGFGIKRVTTVTLEAATETAGVATAPDGHCVGKQAGGGRHGQRGAPQEV